MEKKKVWFVTGASKGLGLSLVKKLLANGYRVAATSRTQEALADAVGKTAPRQFLSIATDLTNEASVAAALQLTNETFGSIDVVVNNAGFGIGGAVEELSAEEIKQSFDINLFATITVIQKALPYMRAQKSGHIINISSIAGFAGSIGWSVYSAAKFAVVGLTEGLAQDVQSLGIKATVVAPGGFRTQFLSSDSLLMSEKRIDDYTDIRATHQRFAKMDGLQAGDPDKAADAMIQLAEHPEPPVILFLGKDAHQRATAKIETMTKSMEQWKDTTLSTDF